MKISLKTHRLYRFQQFLFYLLLLVVVVLLAQFTTSHNKSWDLTGNSRNTLSETTQQLLVDLEQEIEINAFVSPGDEYYPALASLLNRYQQYSEKLAINYINPDLEPELVRSFNIQQQGEMIIKRDDKQEHVFDLSEQSLTNAIITVSKSQDNWLVFVEGHGERDPFSQTNFGLATWGQHLKDKGYKLQSINLIEHGQIPHNTATLVIASADASWLPGELELVKDYIDQGGNLLWLAEPNEHEHLASIAEHLGIEFIPGTLIDPTTKLLGINNPQFALVTNYADHIISQTAKNVSLFPQAVAIDKSNVLTEWNTVDLLTTQENVWSETSLSASTQNVSYDEGVDILGPMTLGLLMNRNLDDDKQQRIAVIGDGDFISNSYLGNGSNLDLSVALVDWLANEDNFIAIPVKTTTDGQLNLTETQSLVIALGFLMALPLCLLSIGAWIWWSRKRR
jgi:ABC-type uncharacterized transport system involved in gliding motility auxiliary subunit